MSQHSEKALLKALMCLAANIQIGVSFFPFVLLFFRWFCHVDDDNYVNPEGLLSLLSTFPQEGDIYVGKPSLDKPITAHELLDGNKTVC